MAAGNREKCPVCGREITVHLTEGVDYRCPKCESEFAVKWDREQRDYIFIDLADRGKGEPLKMPSGSVRSLITLLMCGSCWLMIVTGQDVPPYLFDTILIIFGYYFAFRGVDQLLPGKSSVTGKDAKEPLYAPKGVIRWVLIGGFALSLIYLLVTGTTFTDVYVEFFFIMAGMILGYVSSKVQRDYLRIETPAIYKHGKATIVLILAAVMALSFVLGFSGDLPEVVPRLSIALMGFYFGSR